MKLLRGQQQSSPTAVETTALHHKVYWPPPVTTIYYGSYTSSIYANTLLENVSMTDIIYLCSLVMQRKCHQILKSSLSLSGVGVI